jgi:hypothetical protein
MRQRRDASVFKTGCVTATTLVLLLVEAIEDKANFSSAKNRRTFIKFCDRYYFLYMAHAMDLGKIKKRQKKTIW